MITIIASVTKDNGIGYKGNLIHRSVEDKAFFKRFISNSTVIMGRKTFESIGKPLEGRNSIILSKNRDFTVPFEGYIDRMKESYFVLYSVDDTLRFLLNRRNHRFDEVFVIGGASIYEQFLPFANKMILIRVDTVVEADTFFPEVDYSEWNLISKREVYSKRVYDKSVLDYTVYTYLRKEKYDQRMKHKSVVKLRYDIPSRGLSKDQIGTILSDWGDGEFEVEFDDFVIELLNESHLELLKE